MILDLYSDLTKKMYRHRDPARDSISQEIHHIWLQKELDVLRKCNTDLHRIKRESKAEICGLKDQQRVKDTEIKKTYCRKKSFERRARKNENGRFKNSRP